MVLFELRPLAHAPQLNDRVSRVRLILRAHDVFVIGGRDDPQLYELGIGDEVEADEIGAPFLERGELLFDQLLRRALYGFGHAAGRMPNHFMHVGGEFAA